jgi:hypothetical protein
MHVNDSGFVAVQDVKDVHHITVSPVLDLSADTLAYPGGRATLTGSQKSLALRLAAWPRRR